MKKRLELIKAALNERAYLFEDPIDLFYLTGLSLSKGALLIEKTLTLYVDGRYETLAKKHFPFSVKSLSNLKNDLGELGPKIGFDPDKTSYARFLELDGQTQFMGEVNPCKKIRMIKDADEIHLMKKSAQINLGGLNHALSILKEGITEEEVAKEYEIFCLKQGASKLSFDPIVAFGANSALPHHRASHTSLKAQDVVLIDVGCVYKGYASDMTRTLFYKKEDPELAPVRNFLMDLQKKICEKIAPGVSTFDLAEFSREKIESFGGYKILHSLGHGIGLEVHEAPRMCSQKQEEIFLDEGMVVTVEPGIYLPEKGGFREEDTVVVTKNGHYNFYKN